MADEAKINLNKIPVGWIEIDDQGRIVITNEQFAKDVKKSLESKEARFMDNNGGCDCIS